MQAAQRLGAEIWERLAWTRYRAIAGDAKLAARVDRAVKAFVYGPWDETIPKVMSDIRRRMKRDAGPMTRK